MTKQMTRETKFGKAIAKTTVSMTEIEKNWDGIFTGKKEIITTHKIEIILNGKVLESDSYASVITYNWSTASIFERSGVDKKEKLSKVGKIPTLGPEAAEAINSAIKEMEELLAAEFEGETDVQIETKKEEMKEIAEAKEVVALAEKEGIETLMNAKQVAEFERRYNNLHNEGQQGYVPVRVSKEEYQKALKVLQK